MFNHPKSVVTLELRKILDTWHVHTAVPGLVQLQRENISLEQQLKSLEKHSRGGIPGIFSYADFFTGTIFWS